MNIQKIKLDKIVQNQNNIRIHGLQQIEEFKKSIQQFGVIRPIVVDENFTILCGHGLYIALKDLGYNDTDAIVMKNLTENQKKKLLLADNKIYSLGVDDFDAIDRIIGSLDGDFDIPGFNAEDLELLYKNSSIEEDIKRYDIPIVEGKSVKEQKEMPVKINQEAQISNIGQNAEHELVQSKYIICPHCGKRIYIE